MQQPLMTLVGVWWRQGFIRGPNFRPDKSSNIPAGSRKLMTERAESARRALFLSFQVNSFVIDFPLFFLLYFNDSESNSQPGFKV